MGLGAIDEDEEEEGEGEGSIFSTQSFETDMSNNTATQYRNNKFFRSTSSIIPTEQNSNNNSKLNSRNGSCLFQTSKNGSTDKYQSHDINFFIDLSKNNTENNATNYNTNNNNSNKDKIGRAHV